MTVEEFSREFDLLYGNASKTAPNLDEYEKSVYLTHAQLELVKNYFNPLGNKYGRGFEQSSKRRNDLSMLIRSFTTDRLLEEQPHGNSNKVPVNRPLRLSQDSYTFLLPDDLFLIIQEEVYSDDPLLCKGSGRIKLYEDMAVLNVKPITYDEYNERLRDNPFHQPDNKFVWRLDMGYTYDRITKRAIDLISKYNIHTYNNRYIKYPEPIILVDLGKEFPGEGLTIEGYTTKRTSKLSDSMHSEILKVAVSLAENDYYGGNLQTRVQLNQKIE